MRRELFARDRDAHEVEHRRQRIGRAVGAQRLRLAQPTLKVVDRRVVELLQHCDGWLNRQSRGELDWLVARGSRLEVRSVALGDEAAEEVADGLAHR